MLRSGSGQSHIGEDARFLHQGMTSSDVLDTAFAVQLKQASNLLLKDLDGLLHALKKRVEENLDVITIGRSRPAQYEPQTAANYEQPREHLEVRSHLAVPLRNVWRMRRV